MCRHASGIDEALESTSRNSLPFCCCNVRVARNLQPHAQEGAKVQRFLGRQFWVNAQVSITSLESVRLFLAYFH
jgi:hypothetical protein